MIVPTPQAAPQIIGVISDTHGVLIPAAVDALQKSQLILHAGDIGEPEVLSDLERIAPVIAVKGNMDTSAWSAHLPRQEWAQVGSVTIYILHNLDHMDLDPVAAGIRVVVSGHTHRFASKRHRGVLYLNPGSAGQPRAANPASVARLHIRGDAVDAELIEFDRR